MRRNNIVLSPRIVLLLLDVVIDYHTHNIIISQRNKYYIV